VEQILAGVKIESSQVKHSVVDEHVEQYFILLLHETHSYF
jgi:hypothetical protein